jgi:glycosyltransferase involved in cell wall biosynthesis
MTQPQAPISVVIPAYNAERFIEQTIESVRAQTLPVAEVIVVDDGSSDQTAEVARGLRARVISQPNRGLSAARNAGIHAVTQPWVALLDADDIWERSKIECQWDAVRRCPEASVVSCGYHHIDGRGGPLATPETEPHTRSQHFRTQYLRTRGTPAGPSATLFKRVPGDLLYYFLPLPSTVLARREAFLSGGLFDERLRRCEDVECFLRVLAGHALLVVDQPLVGYRRHDGNLSNDKTLMRSAVEEVLEVMRSRPDNYIRGGREVVDRWWCESTVELGRWLMEGGQGARARALFLQTLRKSFTRRTALLLIFTYGPPAVFKHALNFKRALVQNKVITEALELCLLRRPEAPPAASPE